MVLVFSSEQLAYFVMKIIQNTKDRKFCMSVCLSINLSHCADWLLGYVVSLMFSR